jgi:hypothetical protein
MRKSTIEDVVFEHLALRCSGFPVAVTIDNLPEIFTGYPRNWFRENADMLPKIPCTNPARYNIYHVAAYLAKMYTHNQPNNLYKEQAERLLEITGGV